VPVELVVPPVGDWVASDPQPTIAATTTATPTKQAVLMISLRFGKPHQPSKPQFGRHTH
jgi:hypothetical protein